jgi:glycerophosphoryl diester phosphodiesterase
VALLRIASLTGTSLRLPPNVVAAQVPRRHGPVPVAGRRFVAYCHRIGLQVHVWTIDDPAVMLRLLDLGVDGIMTDDLPALRSAYESRGFWPAV